MYDNRISATIVSIYYLRVKKQFKLYNADQLANHFGVPVQINTALSVSMVSLLSNSNIYTNE